MTNAAAVVVDRSAAQLTNIQSHVQHAEVMIEEGVKNIKEAHQINKDDDYWVDKALIFAVVAVAICVIMALIVPK